MLGYELAARPQSFDAVLSSMCTEPHPAARDAAERFLAANPGDPATYGTVAELEARAVDTLGRVAGLDDPHGYVTSGGTEANLQAVRAARDRSAADDPTVVAPESAHFSLQKAGAVLGVDVEFVPTDADERADPAAMRAATDADTALVVAVAGSTEYGRVDPVPALSAIARDAGALLHVDAAWGGFALPFTGHDWSFADAAVDTMTIDPHKLGRAPVPAGGFLARDRTTMDALAVETPYLETRSQASLTGTRSGAGVAGAVAAMEALWPDGYRAEAERALADAEWLAAELAARGHRVVEPELPLVAADLPERLFEGLRDAGWRLSRTRRGETRVVVMPHVTRDRLRAFLDDRDHIA
ncbi:MAG: tyrosine decarboxylase MnfA [uncultured archaeon A07HB70]|nr:MAG: tyrosine decarboxylase MnfA [uncultured archaeon A07HB70]